jgi:hypothetical protein
LRKRQPESVTDLVGSADDERYNQRGCAGRHHCKRRSCADAHTAA